MNLFKLQLAAAVVCCTLAGGAVALGGIDGPPPWATSGFVGNSTHWHWDFNTPSPFPNSGYGPANSQPPIVTGGAWHQPSGSSDGSWGLLPGQSITIDLPNFPDPNQFKLIWIQYHIFSIPGVPVQPPQIQVEFGGVIAQPNGGNPPVTTPDGGLIGAEGFRFPFNPPFEVIHIFNNTTAPMFFEWLTIDTICAPTPGAGAALLLGGTALLRRRR